VYITFFGAIGFYREKSGNPLSEVLKLPKEGLPLEVAGDEMAIL
jgi:hypothetical protein